MTAAELLGYVDKQVRLMKRLSEKPQAVGYVGILQTWKPEIGDAVYFLAPIKSPEGLPEGVYNGSGPLSEAEIESIEEL